MRETGDKLILTKALGVGIYSAAFKKGALSRAAYDEFIATTTLLNRVGADLAKDEAVHAMTDVTGFGLLGHALEMARGANKTISINIGDVTLAQGSRHSCAAGLRHGSFRTELEKLRHEGRAPR